METLRAKLHRYPNSATLAASQYSRPVATLCSSWLVEEGEPDVVLEEEEEEDEDEEGEVPEAEAPDIGTVAVEAMAEREEAAGRGGGIRGEDDVGGGERTSRRTEDGEAGDGDAIDDVIGAMDDDAEEDVKQLEEVDCDEAVAAKSPRKYSYSVYDTRGAGSCAMVCLIRPVEVKRGGGRGRGREKKKTKRGGGGKEKGQRVGKVRQNKPVMQGAISA